jgi:hypothetical protein
MLVWKTSKKEQKMARLLEGILQINILFSGMGKEVENLIMENNELLATK